MKEQLTIISDDLNHGIITEKEARTKLLILFGISESRFISKTCIDEKCSVCGKPATNKLVEEIPYDDPYPNRHNLTAYVCADHFDMIVRPYSR